MNEFSSTLHKYNKKFCGWFQAFCVRIVKSKTTDKSHFNSASQVREWCFIC